jgi:hypothetical protein
MSVASKECGLILPIVHCRVDEHFHFERSRAAKVRLLLPSGRGLQNLERIRCQNTTCSRDHKLGPEGQRLSIESQHHLHNAVHCNPKSKPEIARAEEMTAV